LLQRRRHALHHLEGTNLTQARMSNCAKMERVVLNALPKEMRLARLLPEFFYRREPRKRRF
jgi:hypothetical protein